MQEGRPKKVRFPMNAIITSGRYKIDVFEVRYLGNDNGDPPFLLHFLMEGVKIYDIEK